MIRLKTAALALALVGVAATGTGVTLTLHAGGPTDPPAAPAPAKAPQAPPEPAWMTAFRKEYDLKEGEYVKRVGPPYSVARQEYIYWTRYGDKQTPVEEAEAREDLDRRKVFIALFLDYDGRRLTERTNLWSPGYLVPERNNSGKVLNLWDAVTLVTGRDSPEIVIDPASNDHPLLSVKKTSVNNLHVHGKPSLTGDFVTRRGAPLDKLVPQLERILREECQLDVRLTLKLEEQPVFVVSGLFKPTPPAWRPEGELDLYATEKGLHKEHGLRKLHPDGSATRVDSETVESVGFHGTPADFVRSVGSRLQTRMVFDTPLPSKPRLTWINHALRYTTDEQAADDRDPEKVLANVSAQTGLVFKKKLRTVEVIYLSAPK